MTDPLLDTWQRLCKSGTRKETMTNDRVPKWAIVPANSIQYDLTVNADGGRWKLRDLPKPPPIVEALEEIWGIVDDFGLDEDDIEVSCWKQGARAALDQWYGRNEKEA